MAEGQGTSAFGGFQNEQQMKDWIDKADARSLGRFLTPALAKIGTMSRTGGNDDELKRAIGQDPDVLSGVEHLRALAQQPVG